MKINKEEARKKFDKEYPDHQKRNYEQSRLGYLTQNNVQKVKDMYYQSTYYSMAKELNIKTPQVGTIVSYLIKKGLLERKNKEKFEDKMEQIIKKLK